MHLNYPCLRAFMEIVRSGSFEIAARKLHVTQSAISQRIKQLEDQLGQVLIVRGNPCRATPTGQALLRHAEQIDMLENELFSTLEMPARQRISVAVNADSIDGWFLDAMEDACHQSGLLLDILVEDQEHSAALLREGRVMAAISANPEPIQGCGVEYLGTMRYHAYCSQIFHNMYFADGINADGLQKAPLLIFNNKDRLQSLFIESLVLDAIEPPQQFVPSTTAFVGAICRGLGWGMLPEHMASPHTEKGELVPLQIGNPIDIGLYWHRWNIRSVPLEALSQSVRAAAVRHLFQSSVLGR
ncbi:HTH-type transcriptional regulator ArgP [Pectobacterium zantedeschiae]|uniref:HTH-type transcriptional regulator ArgP n=2 Tax=Pectobacterium zantedeschiae TaxID=2034769 RepID=UPI00101CA3A6|nr:HTH-type transcriptional regulator ArgP [Pectobacterium zantedeschiae]RYC39703.1 ArgP/LysG family DNA-binding transcriptional regulator [Pectobacterium zantedeschiae]